MANKCEPNNHQWKNIRTQYYAAFSATLIAICHGSITGWFAPAVPLLMSEDTPLVTGPITMEQLSWLGSINLVGGIFSTFTFGYVSSLIGCKRAMTFLTIPAIMFWLVVIFATSYYHILFARFVLGWIGGASQSTVVFYVAEIANNNIRGKLCAGINFGRNIGLLTGYIVGAVIEYAYIPYIFISIPIIFVINAFFLPNTPQYLLRKEKIEKAEKSLRYYKGCRKDATESDEQALKKEFERLKSIATERKGNDKIQLKDLCERKSLKFILIALVLAFLSPATGSFTIMTYAVTICELSGMEMSPYVASIILALCQLVGTLVTTQLADILGRKVVLIVSLLGSSVGLFSLSTYLYLNQYNYNLMYFTWVPVTSLAFIVFMASSGIVPLSGVCTVENIPSKIRSFGLSFYVVCICLFIFLNAKLFPVLLEVIEMHGCMLIMAVASFSGIFFVYFVMEKTSGKCLDTAESKDSTQKEVSTLEIA